MLLGTRSRVGRSPSRAPLRTRFRRVGDECPIRRSDGKCWSGSAWVDAEVWIPASSHAPDWSTWALSWTPDAGAIAAGLPVSITARSTDAAGHVDLTDPVWSTSIGAIVLAEGERTLLSTRPCSGLRRGDPLIRFKVDGVVDSSRVDVVRRVYYGASVTRRRAEDRCVRVLDRRRRLGLHDQERLDRS